MLSAAVTFAIVQNLYFARIFQAKQNCATHRVTCSGLCNRYSYSSLFQGLKILSPFSHTVNIPPLKSPLMNWLPKGSRRTPSIKHHTVTTSNTTAANDDGASVRRFVSVTPSKRVRYDDNELHRAKFRELLLIMETCYSQGDYGS